MAHMLGISEVDLYEHVVNRADKFGFTIDQDVVDFSGGKKDDFIAELDQAFTSWGKTGKVGKVKKRWKHERAGTNPALNRSHLFFVKMAEITINPIEKREKTGKKWGRESYNG